MRERPKYNYEELKAALEAATKGEWETSGDVDIIATADSAFVATTLLPESEVADQMDYDNATFIALSHNLMPTLLEAVEVLRDIEASLKNDTGWSVLKLEAVLEKLK